MPKTTGLGATLMVGVFDLSGTVGAVSSIETSRIVLDQPSINQSAMSRIISTRDGSMVFSSWWTGATVGEAHRVLSVLPRTDVQVSYLNGNTVGEAAASTIAKQITYAPTRGQDGSLVAETSAQASGFGVEWAESLTTGIQTFASGTVNGTAIDSGVVETLFGAAGYLHVISVASGTVVFACQDSADNVAFADIAGMVFTGAAGATTQRLQGAVGATIRRYVRIQATGTYTNGVAVLTFMRYLTTSAS